MPNVRQKRKVEANGCEYNPHVKTIFCNTCGHPVVIAYVMNGKRSRIGSQTKVKIEISRQCMQCGKMLQKKFRALGCIGCYQLCCEKCVRKVCDDAIERTGPLKQTKLIGFTKK